MNVENVVEKIENGALGNVLVTVTVGHVKPFKDMMQIQLMNKAKKERIWMGNCWKVPVGGQTEFGLNMKDSAKGIVFTWKNGIKPSEFNEIESQLVSLVKN